MCIHVLKCEGFGCILISVVYAHAYTFVEFSFISSILILSVMCTLSYTHQDSGLSLSMARLQGHLMRHKQAPADAVTYIHELFEGIKTPSSSTPSYASPTTAVNIHNSIASPVTADSTSSSSSSDTHTHTHTSGSSSNRTTPVKSRGRRVLSVAEVDRMPFNPQPGWDRDIKDISSL